MSVPTPPDEGDTRAELLVKTILECLCTQLADAGRAVCCCAWRRRDRALMPMACECTCPGGQGVAWVRIAQRRFDRVVSRSPGFDGKACAINFIEEWTLEVGVARCWPEGKDGLTCEQETEAAADGAWDEDLILQALLCCKPLQRYNILPTQMQTLGPQGGCVASYVNIIVQPGPRPKGGYGYS